MHGTFEPRDDRRHERRLNWLLIIGAPLSCAISVSVIYFLYQAFT